MNIGVVDEAFGVLASGSLAESDSKAGEGVGVVDEDTVTT